MLVVTSNNGKLIIQLEWPNPDPRSRPQFGQITKLLAGNTGYLLGWSDEDKQISGEDAMKLGAPLESASSIRICKQPLLRPAIAV